MMIRAITLVIVILVTSCNSLFPGPPEYTYTIKNESDYDINIHPYQKYRGHVQILNNVQISSNSVHSVTREMREGIYFYNGIPDSINIVFNSTDGNKKILAFICNEEDYYFCHDIFDGGANREFTITNECYDSAINCTEIHTDCNDPIFN